MRNKLVKLFSYLVPKFVAEFFADIYCLKVKEDRLSLILANKLAYISKLREPPKVTKTIEYEDKKIIIYNNGTTREFLLKDGKELEIFQKRTIAKAEPLKYAKSEPIELGKERTLISEEHPPPEPIELGKAPTFVG